MVDASTPDVLKQLIVPDYTARIERGFLIEVSAFDWNCPQHITPRYSEDTVAKATAELRRRIADLEGEVARLKASE